MSRFAAALLISVALVRSLDATTVVPLSFSQLVNESTSIVFGRVVDVRGQWSDDRRFIESVVSIGVMRGMKGGTAERLAFTVAGGQVGRYINVIPGAPTFAVGDLAVVFLTSRGARLPITTGFTQGIYRVQRDEAGEWQVVPPIVETQGRIVRGDLRRRSLSLAAFETSVKGAMVAPR